MGRPLQDPGTVCAVVRAETRPGADEEAEALLRDFSHQVRSEEPGCINYVVTRVMGSRTHFAVHAHFDCMDAFNQHAETDHMKRVMPRLASLLATPFSMEIFFAV